GIAALSVAWKPFRLAQPLLLCAVAPPIAQAWLSAVRARFADGPARWSARLRRPLLTAALHLMQPLARLRGRPNQGLTPWRRRGTPPPAPPWPGAACLRREPRQGQARRL